MCSKLTIKRPEGRQRCLYFYNFTYSDVFIVNFEHISHHARRQLPKYVLFCGKKKEK